MKALLKVENLRVEYVRGGRTVEAVRDASFELDPGGALGIVGESGSGKSTLALALGRLLPPEARIRAGRVVFEGHDLLAAPEEDLRRVRGGKIGFVFQDPFSALNPVLRLGEQVEEALEAHAGGRDRGRVLELFRRVRLPDPDRMYGAYPHQISGGQRQRVCLAMALAAGPKLLVADEPTTALDVTLQKEILGLLDALQKDLGLAVIFITHNLGLVSERTRRLAVMYAGEIVEEGDTAELLKAPLHPYTQGLLKSLPRLGKTEGRLPMIAGQPPDPRALPPGCPFHPRCPARFEPCAGTVPELRPEADRLVACHLYHEPAAAPR